jgi:hypothetical protein
MVMYQIQLKVLAVRRLPQTFFDQERRRAALAGAGGDAPPTSRRGFRAQAKLGGEGRETGISVWGRGAGVKDARWLPGGDSMVWKVSESTWKHVRAHSPKVKVHLYASDADTPRMETSEAVGWFTIDLRELASGSMDARALKLQGCSPAEVTVEGSLAVVRGDKGKGREARAQAAAELVAEESAKSLQAMPLPAAEALADLDALPIGESATSSDARVFQLCVELKSASGLASLAPHLDGVGVPFWFSYSLFDVVIQTEKFPRLSPEPKSDSLFEPIRDTFRLLATPGDLRRFLADSAPLQIYLCSEGRVIAHSSVELKLVLQGADADLTFAMSEGEYPLVRYDGSHSSSVEASIKCLVSVTHDEEVPIQPQEGSAVAPVAPSFAAEVSDVAKGTSSDVVVASPSSPGEPAGTAAAEGDGQGVAGVAGKPLDNRPHRWRLTVNLVSVKDLDSAAYVLAAYQYPHLGTCAPVRTAVSWAPPRGETPLANSVCTFEFGMSPERLANCAADHPFIVVLRSKERHGERDIGLVRLPLEDLALSTPRCYRCSSTGKNFANAPAYRSYRATRPDRPEPVVVRAVDSYLTVTSADSAALADGAHQPAKRHLPERVCSLRCSMMLEDFGPTKGKDSSAIPTSVPTSGVAVSSPSVGVEHLHAADPESGGGRPEVSEPRSPRQPVSAGNEPPAAGSPDTQDHFTYRVSADAATPSAPQDLQQLCDRELQLLQHEWDTWRTKEEMTWARRLAEKDAALEARWREQDAQRILAVSAAAADYAKLEGKLRKSLGEVEARERALKAKTESFQMEHARKLDELQLLQRRLRDETRHQVCTFFCGCEKME